MSEYWKSTPKYWCKFCKTYVRDTKMEKQQHDATPRHQGNIQRSLRTMHREHEREDREKQRAKNEVARLNGLVSGAASSSAASATSKASLQTSSMPLQKTTPEERKRQAKQLADLGVAIPKEFRSDMAIVGDWETLSERRGGSSVIKQEMDVKSDIQSFGVRKRKYEGAGDEDTVGDERRGWGSTTRKYPGEDTGKEDIEALFKSTSADVIAPSATTPGPSIKKEDGVGDDYDAHADRSENVERLEENIKKEAVLSTTPVVFKKRKGKPIKDL